MMISDRYKEDAWWLIAAFFVSIAIARFLVDLLYDLP